jgi:hypothetical protein
MLDTLASPGRIERFLAAALPPGMIHAAQRLSVRENDRRSVGRGGKVRNAAQGSTTLLVVCSRHNPSRALRPSAVTEARSGSSIRPLETVESS